MYIKTLVSIISVLASLKGLSQSGSLDSQTYIFICPIQPKPEFIGGDDSMKVVIHQNLNWPKDFCGEGMVPVEVTITKSGDLINPKVRRSLCKECDTEAMRVVQLLKEWKPAVEKGKPIDCKLIIPIRFRLE